MSYTNGLDKEAFLQYMFDEFPSVFREPFSREMLENIVDYGTADNFTHTKNELYYFLKDMIPEVEPKDLVPFMDKQILTSEVLSLVEDETKVIQTLDELENFLEDNGWHVGWPQLDTWLLMKVSPAGEDFRFMLSHNGDVDKAIQGIKQFAADFDVEKHVEKWNAARENGDFYSTRLGGLPSEKVLLEDAVAIKGMLDEIVSGLGDSYAGGLIDDVIADASFKCEKLNNGTRSIEDIDFEK